MQVPQNVKDLLEGGLGKHISSQKVFELIRSDGINVEKLPCIVMVGEDKAVVKAGDKAGYYKLVRSGGYWYCGCGKGVYHDGRFCVHAEAVHMHLATKKSLSPEAEVAQENWRDHNETLTRVRTLDKNGDVIVALKRKIRKTMTRQVTLC